MEGIHRSRQGGLALISVLLVFAICAVIAAHLLHRNYLDMRRATNSINGLQADYYALGGEQLARQLLYDDILSDRRQNRALDHLAESWALPGKTFDADEGKIRISIHDAQSRLNVNTFAGQGSAAGPEALVSALLKLGAKPNLAPKILDWVDTDGAVRPAGAEDGEYSSMKPPRRVPNAAMGDISELHAMGVEDESYNRLAPLLVALPASTAVNVNTASPALLDALLGSTGAGARIAALRKLKPIESVAALADAGVNVPSASMSLLGVASSYFEVVVEVEFDGYYRRLISLLVRDTDERGIPRVRVVRRTLGQIPWGQDSSVEGSKADESGR